ncbi:MAG TPA: SDR family oxidoreductase [Methylomirabilota bacterium]|nr:SDR family oxidoreductase [Methylomirabilota bacterium]
MPPQPRGAVKKRGRALVTGGALRLGRVIALALASAGMDVVIGYHRSARAARQTLDDLRGYGVQAFALRADLRDPRAARRLVVEAARRLDGLDVLVNNAAVFARTPFASVTPAQYDGFLAVNLRAAFFCCQSAAAVMRDGAGRIVNIGDVGAERTWPGYIPYTLSKAGIVALTRGLATALRPRRIAVNCVSPGAVLRPAGFPLARWKAVARGQAPRPEDVAAAVLFFATCPHHITGQVLGVD